jgi:hypothetical protein
MSFVAIVLLHGLIVAAPLTRMITVPMLVLGEAYDLPAPKRPLTTGGNGSRRAGGRR